MLANFTGNIEMPSAIVLAVMFLTVCIIITTWLSKRKSAKELIMQHDVDMQKLRLDDAEKQRQCDRLRELELAQVATDRDVVFKRIDSGMIEATRN